MKLAYREALAEPSGQERDHILFEQLRSDLKLIRENTNRLPELAEGVSELKRGMGGGEGRPRHDQRGRHPPQPEDRKAPER
jgi:hypothetical protein